MPLPTIDLSGKQFGRLTIRAGFVPYAMLFRDENGTTEKEWRNFQREWCRPRIVATKLKTIWGNEVQE